jgi:sarcosine oxidase subunit alpha
LLARQQSVSVSFAVAVEEAGLETAAIETDLLVVAGSWQPRLALWLMAGGRCTWHAAARRIAAEGRLDAVALAGSAAGYRSSAACRASGERAIEALMAGSPIEAIEDADSGAIYESRDDATAIAPWRPGRTGSFLDRGATFTTRPAPAGKQVQSLSSAQLSGLSLSDVAAAVELGAVLAEDAGIVAEERCIGSGEIVSTGWEPPPASASVDAGPPPYLRGRFGPKPQQAVIAGEDDRFFEIGCLLFASSDEADPAAAIGTVIGPAPDGGPRGTALVERAALGGGPMFVRDTGGTVPVRAVERIKPAAKASQTAD